jgi:hypothetical protein
MRFEFMLRILVQPCVDRLRPEQPLASELPSRDLSPHGGLSQGLRMDAKEFGHLRQPIRAALRTA